MFLEMPTFSEVTEERSGQQIYVKSDNVNVADILDGAGCAIAPVAHAGRDRNTTYVFRKMGEGEFNATISEQKLIPGATGNPRTREKWLTEHMDHTRAFHNRGVTEAERVAEFAVKKGGYKEMRGQAIQQQGSRQFQPRTGDMKNLTNAEQLHHRPGKLNIGLKGDGNVAKFNDHVLSVAKVDPHSFVNKNEAMMWCRRNKFNAAMGAIGIAIDVGYVTISLIEDDGRFGPKTQVAVREIAGGLAGAEAAVALGSAIGSALGLVVPGIGNIVIGFIGGLIGAIIGEGIVKALRFWFCAGPVAPGPGAPLLDTDPYPTARGVPDSGYDTRVRGVSSQQMETCARGVPSMGLNTGARGTPRPDYKTKADRH